MSYHRYNYTSPSGASSYHSSSYSSPSGSNRYSSTYESSRTGGYGGSGTGLAGSKYGSSPSYGGSLGNLSSSSRYGGYSSPSSHGSSSFSPSSSSYSRTSKYDSGGSYAPRSDYSRSSRPTSSYDSGLSTKYRSTDVDLDAGYSKPSRKTRFADEVGSSPRPKRDDISSSARSARRDVDTSKPARSSDSSTGSQSRRRRERDEGSSQAPGPATAPTADVQAVTRNTENLSLDNTSSQQSAAKPAGAPKPFVSADATSKTAQLPHGDSVATKGTSAFNQQAANADKIPVCAKCDTDIRGPFVLALNKSWCPNHFTCSKCNSELVNMGFVELNGSIYCENDYENFFAPKCAKCRQAIIGDTVNALDKTWHPSCFACEECGEAISSGAFHVEEGRPYCMKDWQRLFQTKCTGCSYPVEPGDKWIEALDANWHSECFVCGVCRIQLEGKPFYPRDGKPFCKDHAAAR